MGPVLIFGVTLLSVLVAWYLWTRAQRHLNYDLKNIPGPKQQPLIGNLGSIFGSSYFHRVHMPPLGREHRLTMASLLRKDETCIKLSTSDGCRHSS